MTSGLNARKEKSRSKIISKENMNIEGAKVLLAASIWDGVTKKTNKNIKINK